MNELAPQEFTITRADLVAYAAASGDHNPIHQDEDVARAVGLPGVIAHGMFTLALVARAVDEWVGEPGRITDLSAKFTRPVVVPPEGVALRVEGARDGDRISLVVTCQGERVLGNPVAVVR